MSKFTCTQPFALGDKFPSLRRHTADAVRDVVLDTRVLRLIYIQSLCPVLGLGTRSPALSLVSVVKCLGSASEMTYVVLGEALNSTHFTHLVQAYICEIIKM